MTNLDLSVDADTVQFFDAKGNGSAIHPKSSLYASLIFKANPIVMSGRSPMFLPEYTVFVNTSANYSLARITLRAKSTSLSFAPQNNFISSIDVTPKCNLGEFVSAPTFECKRCLSGTYSNHVDSLTCK